MDITPYQVAVPTLSIIILAYAWNLVLRRKKTVIEGLMWTFFWVGISYISFDPTTLQYLSDLTGIRKSENAATITAIGVLFFIIFYLVVRIEELEQRLTRVIQERALSDAGIPTEPSNTKK